MLDLDFESRPEARISVRGTATAGIARREQSVAFSFDPNKRALIRAEDFTRAFDPAVVRSEIEAQVTDVSAQKMAIEELDALARAGRTLTIKNMSRRLTEIRTDLIGVDYVPLAVLDAIKLGAELVTRRLIDKANREAGS